MEQDGASQTPAPNLKVFLGFDGNVVMGEDILDLVAFGPGLVNGLAKFSQVCLEVFDDDKEALAPV